MKNKLIHIIICACTFLWTLFIWSNSLRSGVVSGEVSAGVTALINKMLEYLSPAASRSTLYASRHTLPSLRCLAFCLR